MAADREISIGFEGNRCSGADEPGRMADDLAK